MKDVAELITVTFAYDRALWRRGITSWWQSVVPPVPFVQRDCIWAAIWFAVCAVTRCGVSMRVVPDTALPAGRKAKAFRAQLNAWSTE